jgi:hypothetical protein
VDWFRDLVYRLLPAAKIAFAVTTVAAIVLTLAGAGDVAFALLVIGGFIGLPLFLVAASRPPGNLTWEGGYAEPVRAERAPTGVETGEPLEPRRPPEARPPDEGALSRE